MSAYPYLMSPASIGGMNLRNRTVLAAMGSNFADDRGHCTEQLIAYYEERARGGAGLLVLETSAACFPNGATMPNTVGFSRNEFLPGLTELAERVHRHGAKIVAQLNHGGKMAQEDTAAGRPIPVPSPVTKGFSDMFRVLTPAEISHFIKAAGPDGKGPRFYEMTAGDIKETVKQFTDASLRALAAGFDGIEIHAGHGYLLANFLSPATNRRNDAYGGSVENRARFLTEIITAVRDACGPEFPVLVRLDAMEFRIEGGIAPEHAVRTARLCEQAGAAAIDVSAYGNTAHAIAFTEAPLVHEPGGFIDFARAIKQAVDIPVIGVGRIEPDVAERCIASGDFDFLALGRKLLADPELPNKLQQGTPEAVRPCIYCYVCVSQIFINQPMCCAVNPRTGREYRGELLATDTARESILVVGGGPGGMEAARLLATQGHRVSLWERDSVLGGTARIAALAYEPNERLVSYLDREVRRLPIELRLGTAADAESIAREGFDRVILATGARREAPPIAGKEQRHVFDGNELRGILFGGDAAAARKLNPVYRLMLLAGRVTGMLGSIGLMRTLSKLWMPLSRDIVIIGGGLVGLELAEYLVERRRRITVLEPGGHFGAELSIVRRARVLHLLREHGVTLVNNADIQSIEPGRVNYTSDATAQVATCQQVVIALGAQPDNALEEALAGQCEATVHTIGDAQEMGYIEGALRGAQDVVEEICGLST